YGSRNKTRSLWGRLLQIMKPSARIIFIIGKSYLDPDNIPENLQKEIDTYGDILQVDFIDSYNNLTLKAVASLRFVL
ncbi:Hexosyltransferase, partial [Caligus rogercresseyi]